MDANEVTRWREVDALFARALARPEGERAAFLSRECGGDAWLHAAVARLLDAAAEAEDFWVEARRRRSIAWRDALRGRDPHPPR